MTRQLSIVVSEAMWNVLSDEGVRTGESVEQIAQRMLADAAGLDHHTIFQVSTTGALVEGVFTGIATVGDLLRHGDFGVGTFDGLDGELVMVDGVCYRASAGGAVERVAHDALVPFGVVTRFVPDIERHLEAMESLEGLEAAIDVLRPSDNVFVAVRITGVFGHLAMRAACKAAPGEGLVAATAHQSEFVADDVSGVVVGFWSPPYATAINVPGYHLHFISDDRSLAGHVLGAVSGPVTVGLHIETDVHVVIPETAEFLAAHLRGDPSEALDIAESARD